MIPIRVVPVSLVIAGLVAAAALVIIAASALVSALLPA